MLSHLHLKVPLWYTIRKLIIRYMTLNQKFKEHVSKQRAIAAGSYLTVVDNRTGKSYNIPIENNSVAATAFKEIKAAPDTAYPPNQTEDGLRVFDNGFVNTAVMKSAITYV